MFGVGWTEMLLIGIVALVVIGPKDLPVVMNRLGKVVASIRRMGGEFQRELNKTTGLDQIHDLRRSITEPIKQTAAELTREFNKPLPSGATEPTGLVKPTDPKVEDVTDAIKDKLGMSAPPTAPLVPPAMDLVPVESPAPIEAIAPIAAVAAAPKPRKPRAKKPVEAVAAPLLDTAPPAAAAPADEAPKAPRKRRAPKPKTEA